ncbi:MAG: HDOD domain-containing protein, partial [Desulfuromonadaceae bacterium]
LLENLEVTPALIQRCHELKQAGFVLSLDDHLFSPTYEPLYPLVDMVKVDLFVTPANTLPAKLQKLRKYPLKLLAEKIETRQEFQECFDAGFDYFQGYYLAKPAVMEKQRIDGNATALLKLLQQLMNDAEIDEIEETMRMCPGLTYSLLKLVNSVAVGSRKAISSIRHAIAMIGRKQLKRWVQLVLFAADDNRGLENPLVDMAAVRGGMMEQLVLNHDHYRRVGELAEEAFMVGILSLLERIYAVPMEDVVATLNLSAEASAALLHRAGVLGKILACVEAMEQMDFKGGWPGLEALGFTSGQVFAAQCEAFKWKASLA